MLILLFLPSSSYSSIIVFYLDLSSTSSSFNIIFLSASLDSRSNKISLSKFNLFSNNPFVLYSSNFAEVFENKGSTSNSISYF